MLKKSRPVMLVFFAYFDPGSGSLVLQMLVGGSAGLFVFAKYLWSLGRGSCVAVASKSIELTPLRHIDE